MRTESDVLGHGSAFRPWWWQKHVEPPYRPGSLDERPEWERRVGYRWITRRDVFALADDRSPEGRVRLLLAAYVWGTGDSGFLVGRRARTFTRCESLGVLGSTPAAAADLMHADGPVAAYESMLARRPTHVRYLGPEPAAAGSRHLRRDGPPPGRVGPASGPAAAA